MEILAIPLSKKSHLTLLDENATKDKDTKHVTLSLKRQVITTSATHTLICKRHLTYNIIDHLENIETMSIRPEDI